MKNTIEMAKELAASRGGKCLSTIYNRPSEHLQWECKEGHVWFASFGNIKYNNAWCAKCSNRLLLTIEECQNYAKERNGECLSKIYVRCEDHLEWKCSSGHIWFSAFANMKHQKQWCPDCKTSVSEQMTTAFFEFVFKEKFIKIRPDWLKKIKNLELDGYCEKLNLAFEFQGRQHYEPIYGNDNFIRTTENDKYKKDICIKNNVKLIILDGRGNINTVVNYLKCELLKICNNDNELIKFAKNISLFDEDKVKLNYIGKLVLVKELAIKRGYECISDKYVDRDFKLDFTCSEGHLFKLSPRNLDRGSRCPDCSKPSLEKLKKIAEINGGKCLSDKYVDTDTKLKWSCKNNHIWEATANGIYYSGTWCGRCAGVRKHTIEFVKEFCAENNLKNMDIEYITGPMNFKCINNHNFKRKFSVLLNTNKECPICKKIK